MADGLMEHHARPASAEDDIELTGRGGDRFEIHQRLAHRVLNCAFPLTGLDEALIALAPAIAVAAGFLPLAFASDDRDIHSHERPHIAIGLAVRTQDLDYLPCRAERNRYLPHPR